jgi:predicted nucleic acid-binding protein
MRLVLDTNVVASALLWGGPPLQLLRLARDGGRIISVSEALAAAGSE